MNERTGAAPSSGPPWLRVSDDWVTIEIVAHPYSPRAGVRAASERGLIVDVHAAADRGKANAELIATVAKALSVPRSAIVIVRGETSRHKTLRINTVEPALMANRVRSIGDPARTAPGTRGEERTNR
jgi:uncharacterized protein